MLEEINAYVEELEKVYSRVVDIFKKTLFIILWPQKSNR